MGPITTNPWVIAMINMTLVFGVLISLGVLMTLIKYIDPTKKKVAKPVAAPKVAAPTAAPVVVNNDAEITAVIAAAVAAYGIAPSDIACIRRMPKGTWNSNARQDVLSPSQQCF